MRKLLLLLLFLAAPSHAAVVLLSSSTAGWTLYKDSAPYFVRGIVYGTDKVGQNPNTATYQDWMVMDENSNGLIDGPYEAWIDLNKNNFKDWNEATVGDFQLLKNMGVNTIRVYTHASDDPVLEACYPPLTNPGGALLFNHAPNKALLRDLYNTYGIMATAGDEAGSYAGSSCAPWVPGTDYTDPVQIASMTYSIRKMVTDFKDEPWLLMYVLGNENNYDFTHTNAYNHPTEYYTFIGQMVDLIHSLDPYHPVAISNGEMQFLAYAKLYAPHLDIWGANVYRNEGTFTGFGTLFTELSSVWDKPFIITEYGAVVPHFTSTGVLDEAYQMSILLDYTCDIARHSVGNTAPGNAIGGFLYAWMDNWWQAGNEWVLYDGSPNNETTGINGQGNGGNSPFARIPKQAYYMLQSLWHNKCIQCGN